MIIKRKIGNWRITFTFAPVTKVAGVNSNLGDGNHILMWDFDETDLDTVLRNLMTIQRVYALPPIYILVTKGTTNYIAYCFNRTPWLKAVEILASTKGLDWNFFKYGVYREHFTLRVTDKCGRKPKLIWTLVTDVEADCSVRDLDSWTIYETLHDKARI